MQPLNNRSQNADIRHKEESTPAVRRRSSPNRIHHQRNWQSAKRWPPVSIYLIVVCLYVLVPFPLCCLVCLPLECWQTVDASCCGAAESVGVDGQDYATQRSTCPLPHIQPLSSMHPKESVWGEMCFLFVSHAFFYSNMSRFKGAPINWTYSKRRKASFFPCLIGCFTWIMMHYIRIR